MILRNISDIILEDLSYFPVVGILGARQVGKTTLAKDISTQLGHEFIYLDLELDSDLRKLADAETYLRGHSDKCVIIDEIQREPRLFPLLRGLVDEQRRPGRFLLLGSSSPDLIRDSSESLAGRISYTELAGLSLTELPTEIKMREHWFMGGYPQALLTSSKRNGKRWLTNYIKTITEKDLRDLGISISPVKSRNFLRMLSHLHGQLLNANDLARSMGLSQPTIQKYIDILEGAYIINRLEPYYTNIGKRLVKSPKVYIRDSGLLHRLLGIADLETLYGHPNIGNSWEGYVVEEIKKNLPEEWEMYFYRTYTGAESDLVLRKPSGDIVSIEVKYSNSPKVSKGFYQSTADIQSKEKYILVPETETYMNRQNVTTISLQTYVNQLFIIKNSKM